MTEAILHPKNQWEWFGLYGHFICGRWCRFHMTTKVGPWLVSTVGLLVHPRASKGSEQEEARYLKENPNGEEVGCDRFYETLVFRAGDPCVEPQCKCGQPTLADGCEVDGIGSNTAGEATIIHNEMCDKWSRKEKGGGS